MCHSTQNILQNEEWFLFSYIKNKYKCPTQHYIDELESMALDYVKQLKENYPIIRKTPKGVYRKTKSNVVDWGLKKTQIVLQTFPGKVAVWGVGAASNVSDRILSTVQYYTHHQPKDPCNFKNSKERLGSYSAVGVTGPSTKSPDKAKRRMSLGNSAVTFVEYTLVLPIEVTARFLQTIHLWFHILLADAEEQSKKQNGLSIEQTAEIKNRRKVSPKKRVRRSSIKSWGKTAIRFFGLDRILPFFRQKSFLKNIDPSLKDSSPNKSDDSENKRKFDDILSDDSSGLEEPSYMDHLRRLDLSEYMSEEDSDYEPGLESTDSEEYAQDDTETDEELSIIGATPDPIPPRNKSTPVTVSSNTPSKSKSEKNEKTPKKSILKQTSQVKENENIKSKPKTLAEKVKTEENNKDYVQLTFKASRLDSKDIIGKSDPYLTLMKQNPDGKWQILHKTEVIMNSSDPSWKPFSVPLLTLWNGDKTKQIKITVYDKDDAVADDYVGEALVTLEEVLKASKQEITWNIVNPKKQSKKKNYINSGQIHLVSCKGILEESKEK